MFELTTIIVTWIFLIGLMLGAVYMIGQIIADRHNRKYIEMDAELLFLYIGFGTLHLLNVILWNYSIRVLVGLLVASAICFILCYWKNPEILTPIGIDKK